MLSESKATIDGIMERLKYLFILKFEWAPIDKGPRVSGPLTPPFLSTVCLIKQSENVPRDLLAF